MHMSEGSVRLASMSGHPKALVLTLVCARSASGCTDDEPVVPRTTPTRRSRTWETQVNSFWPDGHDTWFHALIGNLDI